MIFEEDYRKELEKYAAELYGNEWKGVSESLKTLLIKALRLSGEDLDTFEKKWFQSLKEEKFVELMFPPLLLLKTFGESVILEEREHECLKDFLLAHDEVGLSISLSEVLKAYNRLLEGSVKTVHTALVNFESVVKDWDAEDSDKIFSKWIECADNAHAEWILTEDFSKDFGKCSNYYISRFLKAP